MEGFNGKKFLDKGAVSALARLLIKELEKL